MVNEGLEGSFHATANAPRAAVSNTALSSRTAASYVETFPDASRPTTKTSAPAGMPAAERLTEALPKNGT